VAFPAMQNRVQRLKWKKKCHVGLRPNPTKQRL